MPISRMDTVMWPEIADAPSARAAARLAWQTAFAVAGFTAFAATVEIFRLFLGIDPAALLDAALIGVVAWRIQRMSRAWAVVGLVIWLYNMVARFTTLAAEGRPLAFGLLGVFILVAFINGVRGTFAFHRSTRKEPEVLSV